MSEVEQRSDHSIEPLGEIFRNHPDRVQISPSSSRWSCGTSHADYLGRPIVPGSYEDQALQPYSNFNCSNCFRTPGAARSTLRDYMTGLSPESSEYSVRHLYRGAPPLKTHVSFDMAEVYGEDEPQREKDGHPPASEGEKYSFMINIDRTLVNHYISNQQCHHIASHIIQQLRTELMNGGNLQVGWMPNGTYVEDALNQALKLMSEAGEFIEEYDGEPDSLGYDDQEARASRIQTMNGFLFKVPESHPCWHSAVIRFNFGPISPYSCTSHQRSSEWRRTIEENGYPSLEEYLPYHDKLQYRRPITQPAVWFQNQTAHIPP